jgi:hypothetical protein
MAVRTCQVSCRDPQRASSTPSRLALRASSKPSPRALRVFREYEWCDLALAASVLVRIRQPEVEHRVQLRDFYNWLEAAGKSPAEMALKTRLRALLSKGSSTNKFLTSAA